MSQNEPNPDTQVGIYAPIDKRQNQEEEVFSTQKGKEFHRDSSHAPEGLNCYDPVNTEGNQEIHVILLSFHEKRQAQSKSDTNRQIFKTPLQYLTIRLYLLYTQDMKKLPVQVQPYWWDWSAVALLFILVQVCSSRLITTNWTPHLNFIQIFTSMGLAIGLALGYSQFKRKAARWISFGYMLFMLPLIWSRVIDEQVELDERLLSVGGRLLYSISEFLSRRPVEDPLFFVAIMSITFWVISASAGFASPVTRTF